MKVPPVFLVVGDPGRDCGYPSIDVYFFDEQEAEEYARKANEEKPQTLYYSVYRAEFGSPK